MKALGLGWLFRPKSPSVEVTSYVPPESSPWEKIDLLVDRHSAIPDHHFLPKQRQMTPDVKEAFHTEFPLANSFLLHHGRGWNKALFYNRTPVILIHGAGMDATTAFDKLAPALVAAGHPVFAVTVPHNQWAVESWCHYLGAAIRHVKTMTDSRRVNLIGHSLGGIAASMYTTALRAPWMSHYEDREVDKLVLLGSPRAGFDAHLRFTGINTVAFNRDDPRKNYPMTWTAVRVGWVKVNTKDLSLVGGYFPAMCQITRSWDEEDPIPDEDTQTRMTYYGTPPDKSSDFDAPGIETVMDAGGRFIERLMASPVSSDVKLFQVAGTYPLPDVPPLYALPNDGYVLRESAWYYHASEQVTFQELPLNHRELVRARSAVQLIIKDLEG